MFLEPIYPSFISRGETQVRTVTGGILTALLAVVFIGYALIKLTHLLDKKNPLIAETKETNFYDFNTRINLNEIDFKMAFTVEGYQDKKIKDDPRYVKFIARMYYRIDGVKSYKLLDVHKCSD